MKIVNIKCYFPVSGVCEPIDSADCKAKNAAAKEDWEFCEQGEFKCDALKQPGIKWNCSHSDLSRS